MMTPHLFSQSPLNGLLGSQSLAATNAAATHIPVGEIPRGPHTAKDGGAAEPAPFPRDRVAKWLSRETVLSAPSVTDGKTEAPAGQRLCPSLEPVFRLPARGLLAQNIPSPLPLPAPAASHGVSPAAAALIRNWPVIQTVCLQRVPVQWYPPRTFPGGSRQQRRWEVRAEVGVGRPPAQPQE